MYFTNEKFSILKLLSDHQITVKDEQYASLSQQEIADMVHFSKKKANRILNELIERDYIVLHRSIRGKYALTEKGNKVIKVVIKEEI